MRDYHWFLLKPNVPVCYVLLRTVCRKKQKKQNYFIFYHYSRGRILGLIIFYSYCPMNVELIRKK